MDDQQAQDAPDGPARDGVEPAPTAAPDPLWAAPDPATAAVSPPLAAPAWASAPPPTAPAWASAPPPPGAQPTMVSWSSGLAYAAPPPRRSRRWPVVLAAVVGGVLLTAAQFAGGNAGSMGAGFSDPDGPAPTPAPTLSGYDTIAAPSEGVGETPRPTGIAASPLAAGSSPDFAYLDLQNDGITPVTWSPCRPIHYVVRADGEPAGGLAQLTSAIAEVSKLTGLTFVYDGRTSEALVDDRALYQPGRYGERWAPVLVAWTTPATDTGLTDDLIAWASPYRVRADDGRDVIVSGEIHVDRDEFADEMTHGERAMARATLLHELGHLVGLDHVSDDRLLMNPDATEGVVDFSPAEKRGLASLGAGACHSDV